MESLQTFINIYLFVSLVWGILCLILFFKIWGMTNDVKAIKEHLISSSNNSIKTTQRFEKNYSNDKEASESSYNVGDIVIEKATNNTLMIHSITDEGNYICKLPNENSTIFVGTFSKEQLIKKEE